MLPSSVPDGETVADRVNGLRLDLLRSGNGDGSTVLLLRGYPSSSFDYRVVVLIAHDIGTSVATELLAARPVGACRRAVRRPPDVRPRLRPIVNRSSPAFRGRGGGAVGADVLDERGRYAPKWHGAGLIGPSRSDPCGVENPVATTAVLDGRRELRPGGEVIELPGMGHYPQVECPTNSPGCAAPDGFVLAQERGDCRGEFGGGGGGEIPVLTATYLRDGFPGGPVGVGAEVDDIDGDRPSRSKLCRMNSCRPDPSRLCSVVTTACTGAAAGSFAFISASIAVFALLSASLGWADISVFTAPVPALGAAPAVRTPLRPPLRRGRTRRCHH